MNHDPDCEARFAAWSAERDAYDAAWPNHCPDCRGWGGQVFSYDPSPAGVALSPGVMWDFDPCPTCYETGRCPRCDKAGIDEDEAKCDACGWKEGDPGSPESPECLCWMAEEYDFEDLDP